MIPSFDSRNSFYRTPFGAVEEGTSVHMRILVPYNLRCNHAELAIKYDYDYDWQFITMNWYGPFENEMDVWECDFTPEKKGLYWYSFRIHTTEGLRFIVPADVDRKSSVERSPGRSWQLTCYKKGFKTPDWPVGGVMYQIFPDRFNFSGEEKNITRTDLEIQNDWYAMPRWQPNHNGEITNTDFFKGDLKGITQKLPYLKDLGVTCIYLNPICEAYSNHRYDTGDYLKVDPMLGTNEDFVTLCKEAKKLDIHVINDGVFSHTGSDSVYFNRSGKYGEGGAFRDQSSPYYSWYNFSSWPYNYNSWWGFYTLPEVNELDEQYNEFINGENGVVRQKIKDGNSGWRLDVADELPDLFLERLRKAVKEEDEDAIIIGEVWEDASNKESYGARRKFLLGEQVDSVMNYVFRGAILDFVRGTDSKYVMDQIMSVCENYPRPVLRVLMNSLSTHDTERALTVMAGEPLNGRDRSWQANQKLTHEQRSRGIRLMKLASGIQFTLPGFPCIYYGDEAGMEGYRDPFNRACYPWGREDKELIEWHKELASLRRSCPALWDGDIINLYSQGRLLSYMRTCAEGSVYCAFNTGFNDVYLQIPPGFAYMGRPVLGTHTENGKVKVPSLGCAFIVVNNNS
ncbi:MAG: glycoside hydrolase family 13 protein [Eubacteriales bacterium]|nr:glycoside hydrolase family 13 protein [Eubacteriales bacterium]